MSIYIKNSFIIFLIIFIGGCSFKNSELNKYNISSIIIKTPEDRDNTLFNEYLKRVFNTNKNIKKQFILETTISFSSVNTLSVSGLKTLNRTYANVKYKLYNYDSHLLIKSGSIKSFPAIGSTSSSLYSNDISLKNTKERLNMSAAKKLYLHLNIILRRLK